MMNENSPLKPKPITLLLIAALTVSLLLSIVRNAKNDEVHYLTDSLQISDSLQTGQWIGNETVGFHGFLFKIPAALLFIITGPSVFAATLTNIVLALLSVYLSYLLLLHFLESPKWALAGSALVFTAIFFLRALASFKRDTAIVFALLLLLFLVVKKKNKWLIGLGLLLVLDAKESVFFMILPGFILWMIYSRFPESKRNNPRPQLRRGFGRFTAFFFPSILFLILMFTTPLVPLNPVAGKILGLNHGGFKTFLKDAFRPVKNNPLAPDDPDNITDGSGARFRFFKMDDTAWWTDYAGEIERLAEFVTEEKLAVIKLTKPKGKSSHPSGGHVHIGRHLAKPARYAAGDYILFSLRYKAPKGKTINPLAVNRYMDGSGETVTKRFRINKDGQWHRGEVSVRVTRDGVIRPEILWPYARDMVLYLAGWKVEKNAPSKFQGKIKTMGFDARFILSYAAKPFNSRTFSFTSMPRFIILPALLMSFLMFREWKRKEEFEKLILPFILWFYVIIYVFRSGFGRYILPMVPVIMLFFIFFLRDGLRKKKFARNTLAAVTVFTAVGVFFETNYPLVKVLLALFFLAGMWFIYYRQHRPDKSSTHPSAYPSTTVLKEIYITLICVLSFFVFLGTSYSNARQLGRYIAWGHNSQMSEIARLFNPKEPVWINFDRGMIQFYRHDGRYTPFKEGVRSWELKPWVPKATLLKRVARYYTYGFEWEDPGEFREQLHEKSIRKVALLVSTHPGEKYRFPFQERLPQLLKMPFLKRENTITMKNKTLHLFTVKQ